MSKLILILIYFIFIQIVKICFFEFSAEDVSKRFLEILEYFVNIQTFDETKLYHVIVICHANIIY